MLSPGLGADGEAAIPCCAFSAGAPLPFIGRAAAGAGAGLGAGLAALAVLAFGFCTGGAFGFCAEEIWRPFGVTGAFWLCAGAKVLGLGGTALGLCIAAGLLPGAAVFVFVPTGCGFTGLAVVDA